MADSIITENNAYSILKTFVEDGLAQFGYTEWSVQQRNSAEIVNTNSCIMIEKILDRRIGFQATKYNITSSIKQRWEWIDEYTYQITSLKKRTKTDTADTITAEDVCNALISWFNSEMGCSRLRSHGMASIRVASERVIVYNDDSGLYQKEPSFDVRVQIPKTKEITVNAVTTLEVVTHPI